MRINNNIQALNSYNQLNKNQFRTSKSLERLSSGMRINRASDDAAGLAISEKMRGQIRGLQMAERNALDGVSLLQTTEGALTEVHAMLQRMRELAVQAANDTNTGSDRLEIQREIDQLLKEIDSIAEKTEFNTRKLLNGESSVQVAVTTPLDGLASVRAVEPEISDGDYELNISNATLVNTVNKPGAGVNAGADIITAIGTDAMLGEYTINVKNFNDDSTPPTALVEVYDPNGFLVGKVTSEVNTSGTLTIADPSNASISIDINPELIKGNGTVKVSVELEVELEMGFTPMQDPMPATFDSYAASKTMTTKDGLLTYVGFEMQLKGFDSGVHPDGDAIFRVNNNALAFQVGPNSNQYMNIDVEEISTVMLNIDQTKVTSYDEASKAILAYDKAIVKVSSLRSKLGAIQNRLEHTLNNLSATRENLSASESRIRDADMAMEMTEFTRNNIINQAATAMLAQANQLPQGVLQLLQ